jgi:nucleoside-triphosphatase THEP1
MIKIVSDAINTGKTSWMRWDYASQTKADGFFCIKVFKNDEHIGYDLIRPLSGKSVPFIRRPGFLEPDWQEKYRIRDQYSFNNLGLLFAKEIVTEAINNKVSWFYLDELGPLELQGKAFAPLFTQLLEAQVNLVIAVRAHLLAQVIEKFSLNNCQIVKPWVSGA